MSSPSQFSERCSGAGLSAEIRRAAADWLARRDRGFEASEASQFEVWLAADFRHAEALTELSGVWSALNRPRLTKRASDVIRRVEELESRGTRRRNRFRVGAVSLVAAAAVACSFLLPDGVLDPKPSDTLTPTAVVRPDRQILPDGSALELNAGAEVVVDYSPTRRVVRLVRGEALFSVAKDSSRPFVVTAGALAVRAIGTMFAVRFEPESINVLVTEGQVAVERTSDGQNLLKEREPEVVPLAPASMATVPTAPTLVAGHQVIIPRVEVPVPVTPVVAVPTEIAGALAWRHRRVEFSGTPLSEAIVLFNRGPPPHLQVANEETADLQISGIFWTDDAEGFARLLESSLGVTAARRGGEAIVLRK